MHGSPNEKRGKLIDTSGILNAAQAASQHAPQSLSFNYDNLFKIQRVRNPFVLGPVSYSALAAYLECPWCMTTQRRKKRSKEPAQFTTIRQKTLFGKGQPDPRMIGTLLHTIINLLHDEKGPLTQEKRAYLLADASALVRFIRQELLVTLQKMGKINLATFFYELSYDAERLHPIVTVPILHYQHELYASGSEVFAAAERFQCKLLSTKNTFADHPDRGGFVCLVGEFDQIRLRKVHSDTRTTRKESIPAIIEFKKGLGGKKNSAPLQPSLFGEEEEGEEENDIVQPTVAHAMQLMTYWIAFQTRWDVSGQFKAMKGQLLEIPMSVYQPVELVLYDLNNGEQYLLQPSNYSEALTSLIECIFYLSWAMKSGYAWQSPEHECKRAQLAELPAHALQVQVGYTTLTGQECYLLAKDAFDRFKSTIQWKSIKH